MADIKSTSTNNTTGSVSLEATQKLLDQALAQEPTVRTCKDDYGMHTWVKHEETLMEYCSVCHLRKDRWIESKGEIGPVEEITTDDLPKTDQKPVNTGEKQERKPGTFVEGDERINRAGRPPGSKNFATQMRELMSEKMYTLKDEATGQSIKINAMKAMLEKTLELAIKKGDREAIRMIWEMLDGKATQQHKIEVNGPKGYQIDPDREKVIHEQFGLYSDRLEVVPVAETLKIAPVEVEQVKTIETPAQPPNPTPEAREVAKTGVIEPQPHATTINQPNTGVVSAPQSVTGGVREA